MRLCFTLLAAVLLAGWTVLAASSHGSNHSAHAADAVSLAAGAGGHGDHGHGLDCCAVEGGVHCASSAGLTSGSASAGPSDANVIALAAFDVSPHFARNPNPALKPPRA